MDKKLSFEKPVQILPDKPAITAVDLKKHFDSNTYELLAYVNELIDALASSSGSELVGHGNRKLNNVLDAIINDILLRFSKTETIALVGQETSNLVKNVDINLSTGVITVTKKDGTTTNFDTALEKVPATFNFIQRGDTFYLEITNIDGTKSEVELTRLMNTYNFVQTPQINFSESQNGTTKTIQATIRSQSIGLEHLSLSAVTTLESLASSASQSATTATTKANEAATSALNALASKTSADNSAASAAASKTAVESLKTIVDTKTTEASSQAVLSKSYAVGGTGTRAGEDVDNAKYYAGLANPTGTYTKAEVDSKITNAKTELNTTITTTSTALNTTITANKDKVHSITLSKANWTNTAPYTQTITTVPYDTASNTLMLDFASNDKATLESYSAMFLRATAVATNSITISALGDKPTVDIALVLTVGVKQ